MAGSSTSEQAADIGVPKERLKRGRSLVIVNVADHDLPSVANAVVERRGFEDVDEARKMISPCSLNLAFDAVTIPYMISWACYQVSAVWPAKSGLLQSSLYRRGIEPCPWRTRNVSNPSTITLDPERNIASRTGRLKPGFLIAALPMTTFGRSFHRNN